MAQAIPPDNFEAAYSALPTKKNFIPAIKTKIRQVYEEIAERKKKEKRDLASALEKRTAEMRSRIMLSNPMASKNSRNNSSMGNILNTWGKKLTGTKSH